MKKHLLAGLFALFFGRTEAHRPAPWEQTYTCFQAYYTSLTTSYRKAVALELTFTFLKTDSLLVIRNTVSRRVEVIKVGNCFSRLKYAGYTLNEQYNITDNSGKERTMMTLGYKGGLLKEVVLFSREGTTQLTIFYPLYKKI